MIKGGTERGGGWRRIDPTTSDLRRRRQSSEGPLNDAINISGGINVMQSCTHAGRRGPQRGGWGRKHVWLWNDRTFMVSLNSHFYGFTSKLLIALHAYWMAIGPLIQPQRGADHRGCSPGRAESPGSFALRIHPSSIQPSSSSSSSFLFKHLRRDFVYRGEKAVNIILILAPQNNNKSLRNKRVLCVALIVQRDAAEQSNRTVTCFNVCLDISVCDGEIHIHRWKNMLSYWRYPQNVWKPTY